MRAGLQLILVSEALRLAAPEMADFATASFRTDDSEVESAVNLKLAYAQA
jgi:hypothetical protein